MRKLLTTAMLLLSGSLSAAGFSSSARGTTAGGFLELGVGGRAMGMGGAYTAAADDATVLYWNPAGLTGVERRAASFMHASHLQGSFYDYAAYAQKLGDKGTAAASFQYFDFGSLTQTDANYNALGSFHPNDLALTAGYARKIAALDGVSAGASVKYIRSVITQTAQTAAVDLGLTSRDYLDRRLRVAAAVLNMGGTLKFRDTAENLPLTFKAGGLFRITPRWATTLDLASPRDDDPYAAFGTEYVLPVSGGWEFAGRMGYNSQTLGDVTGVSGLSMGVGVGSRGLSFDYAFTPYGGVGISNRFSVSAKF
ncbi:MAG: PorV/PorQ family protein [Elusimicrobia bacterium]|nr:PorV/PorQ family protein [Elusimicrobiota bacterium]